MRHVFDHAEDPLLINLCKLSQLAIYCCRRGDTPPFQATDALKFFLPGAPPNISLTWTGGATFRLLFSPEKNGKIYRELTPGEQLQENDLVVVKIHRLSGLLIIFYGSLGALKALD